MRSSCRCNGVSLSSAPVFPTRCISSKVFSSLAALAFLNGCSILFPWDRRYLENPEFQTPERTFLTFAAGVRGDRPGVEYLCFSEKFKDRLEITVTSYLFARERILREHPHVKWLGYMRVEQVGYNDDETAFIRVSFFGKKLLVRFVRENEAFISFRGNRRPPIEFTLPDPLARSFRPEGDQLWAVASHPDLRGINPRDIESFQIIPEWKILDFEQP